MFWRRIVEEVLLERETGAVCVVIGGVGNGIGRPATRAKALNLYRSVHAGLSPD